MAKVRLSWTAYLTLLSVLLKCGPFLDSETYPAFVKIHISESHPKSIDSKFGGLPRTLYFFQSPQIIVMHNEV